VNYRNIQYAHTPRICEGVATNRPLSGIQRIQYHSALTSDLYFGDWSLGRSVVPSRID